MSFETLREAERAGERPGTGPGAPGPRRPWVWLLAFALGAIVLWAKFLRPGGGRAISAEAAPSHPAAIIPVTAVPVTSGDLNLYLTALGSVTAFNTVTVKSRVDGQLVKVYYREGQLVQAGELLAEIDPRPYAAQLHQAEGQLARDRATLANARIMLARDRAL